MARGSLSNKKPTKKTVVSKRERKTSQGRSSANVLKHIVGIGASAGGLEALRSLFSALKRADHMAFVVVQHLAPQHRSRLTELISHATKLPVREIRDGEELEEKTIYITPPNADVFLEDRKLRLRKPRSAIGPKPSVDLFFKSLAEAESETAIGVILSGTGSDGAQGIGAIKAAGGLTLCQRLESAKYDGMPRAAKLTGFVDLELSPEEIAAQLGQLDEFAARSPAIASDYRSELLPNDPFHTVLSILKRETKVDFSQYKQSTVRRRLERRIVANQCKDLKEYAELLKKKPSDTHQLFQDILISVTSFFRDEMSFKTLSDYLVGKIKKKEAGQSFRVWVVGCATGEEAYSIAILLAEAMERAKKQLPVQIFATDLDERAMAVARKAIYPRSSLMGMTEELIVKYFDAVEDQSYKVKDFVRDMIVFARHDVTVDPPFLKLDLITCRNVLIYFTTKLQEQVIKTFHYALESGGVLFLGKSETTSAAGEGLLFEPADKTSRIFYRLGKKSQMPRAHSRNEQNRETDLMNQDRETGSSLELFHAMVLNYAPDSILVDPHNRIRHLYGDANRYLNLPKGAPTASITKLVSHEMAIELTALLARASKSNRIVKGHRQYVFNFDKESRTAQIAVVPLAYESRRDFLVSFEVVKANSNEKKAPILDRRLSRMPLSDQVRMLNDELLATREHMQTIAEEHDTANEELQALNEELQSSNEELQSTNEELETTNEELQSANEELTTLNQEINVKSAEYQVLNLRLQAIQNAIFYPLMIVDRSMRLIDYNPAARYLFRVTDGDKGDPLKQLVEQFDIQPVLKLLDESLENARDGKIQFKLNGRDYEARVQLFHGFKDQIEGAVISFVDNTDLVQALQSAELHQARLDAILDHTPALVTMKDTQGNYVYVNKRFCQVLNLSADEVLGKSDEELFKEPFAQTLREHDYDVIKMRKSMRFEDAIEIDGKTAYWLSSKFPLLGERNKVSSVCTISLDITDRILQEKQLQVFRQVMAQSSVGLAILERRADGRYTIFVSDRIAKIIGEPQEKLLDIPKDQFLKKLLQGSSSVTPELLKKTFESQGYASFTVNLQEKTAGDNWVELKTDVMDFEGTGPEYIVLMLFDINEQVRTKKLLMANQEEMSRFSKLATMGELAAGISHEINTPLNVITSKADLLRRLSQRDKLDQDRLKKASEEIDQMVKNISSVIQGLKSLSGMENNDAHTVDLSAVIREAAGMCDFKLQRFGVKLNVHLPPHEVLVKCNAIQITQILVNLINNAVDAVSELPERWISIDLKETEKRILLRVTDSGSGIDPELTELIMTPFFTTKKEKNGTGLGLSLSRTIARKHGGDLKLDVENANTSFTLELPKKLLVEQSERM